MHTIRQIFAFNLRRIRESKNLTQEQLAQRLGDTTSQRYVSEYERGKRWPTESFTDKLCKALDIAPKELFLPIGYYQEKAEQLQFINDLLIQNRKK